MASLAKEMIINEFPVDRIGPGKNVLFVGRTGVGKTFAALDILRQIAHKFDYCVGMSPTESTLDVLRQIFTPSTVYDRFDEDALMRVVQALQDAHHDHKPRTCLLFMDDIMSGKGVMKTEAMRIVHFAGRHSGICLFNMAQYCVDIPKSFRDQIHIVFAFAQAKTSYAKALYDNFFEGPFDRLDEFKEVLNLITKDRSALVVDASAESSKQGASGKDRIFSYKASPKDNGPPPIMGGREAWRLHHLFYRPPMRRQRPTNSIPCIDAFGRPMAVAQQPPQIDANVVETVTKHAHGKKPRAGASLVIVRRSAKPTADSTTQQQQQQQGPPRSTANPAARIVVPVTVSRGIPSIPVGTHFTAF